MDRNLVIFFGLALVLFVYWTGPQRHAMAALWNGSAGYTGPNGGDSGPWRQGGGNPPGGPLAPGKHKGGGIGA